MEHKRAQGRRRHRPCQDHVRLLLVRQRALLARDARECDQVGRLLRQHGEHHKERRQHRRARPVRDGRQVAVAHRGDGHQDHVERVVPAELALARVGVVARDVFELLDERGRDEDNGGGGGNEDDRLTLHWRVEVGGDGAHHTHDAHRAQRAEKLHDAQQAEVETDRAEEVEVAVAALTADRSRRPAKVGVVEREDKRDG
eukprot:5777823-Pleurochrysis_carterae.AAC.3